MEQLSFLEDIAFQQKCQKEFNLEAIQLAQLQALLNPKVKQRAKNYIGSSPSIKTEQIQLITDQEIDRIQISSYIEKQKAYFQEAIEKTEAPLELVAVNKLYNWSFVAKATSNENFYDNSLVYVLIAQSCSHSSWRANGISIRFDGSVSYRYGMGTNFVLIDEHFDDYSSVRLVRGKAETSVSKKTFREEHQHQGWRLY